MDGQAVNHPTRVAPSRTWMWEDLGSWESVLWELLRPQVTPGVIRRIEQQGHDHVVGDDIGWLDDTVRDILGYEVDMKRNVSARLHEQFDAIRAFHGARPTDVERYFSDGIRLLQVDTAWQRAQEIFLGPDFPAVTAEGLRDAFDRVMREDRAGLLHFEANRTFLEDFCGHYMLYGSEYLVGVAALLDVRLQYGRFVRRRGTPTVFICDLPLAHINDGQREAFAGQAIEAVFSKLLNKSHQHPPPGRDNGIVLNAPLPRECIVGCYKPKGLSDPLLGFD